jgi:predicted GNAT family acetyltransferase
VHLTRLTEVDAFLAEAGAFLEAREAEHNLILGICSRLVTNPSRFGHDPYFSVVREGDAVVAAVIRTPPYNPVLSEVDDDTAIELVVHDLLEAFGTLPGVLGPVAASAAFAATVEERTGVATHRSMGQRTFRASSVVVPSAAAGTMRAGVEADRPLMVDWVDAFMLEAIPEHQRVEGADALVDERLAASEGGLALWVDGRPVSLAGWGGRTPNGIRVGPVYTPPADRGRGYATALVGRLTTRLLERYRYCFLFTDVANPTSNAIYERIGYEPITDVDQWRFG